ncbi:MAG: BspA family leucine-rich repeat surface protein [Dyadobacter fermentans]
MKHLYCLIIALLIGPEIFAQDAFITRWNLSNPGLWDTQISFFANTSGPVTYYWKEISPGTASGSGMFNSSGGLATIRNLPAGSTIDLSVQPENFDSFRISDGPDKERLIDVRQWGTTDWTSMQSAFQGCVNLQISAADIPDLSRVTNMQSMFSFCKVLNGPENIGLWQTGNVTNMMSVFDNALAFNQPIGSWNTSRVTTMDWMFSYALSFNQPLGEWDTGNVTGMLAMFQAARAFDQPIGDWNVGAVTTMGNMFFDATQFNRPIGRWNTAKVTNMDRMFSRAVSFNQPLNNWDVSKVTSMSSMFGTASAFNQSLGSWTFHPAVNLANMLNSCGMDTRNYDSTLNGWNQNPLTPNGRTLHATGLRYSINALVSRNNLINNKGWTILRDSQAPLPVRLISLTGMYHEKAVTLNWTTSEEENNAGFEIQKSADAVSFEKIGFVRGSSDTKTLSAYQFFDLRPFSTTYYRLKQLDHDGTFAYSRIISVKNKTAPVKIYPNPARDVLFFEGERTPQKAIIVNLLGQKVWEEDDIATSVDISSISDGFYIVKIGEQATPLVIRR